MKKLLLIMLGVLMALPAFTRDFTYPYKDQTLTYTVIDEDEKTVSVSQGENDVSGVVVIPSIAKDGDTEYTVTLIKTEAFYYCTSLTSVEIPNSITSIGEHAFFGCDELTSVVIPNSVTSIGDGAFNRCSNLASVTIGDAVETIGEYAFFYCTNLTSVVIGNSVKSIGKGAFKECSNLTSVVIPNSVTSIGNDAFYNCSALASIEIPNSIESIGNGTFYGCGLTSVEIPNSVKSIGKDAFNHCTALASVTIGDAVETIGDYAFYYCTNLTSVVIGNAVESIGSQAFNDCRALTSIEIPNSVKSIGFRAFYGCHSLTSVIIPSSVTLIGSSAFSDCASLKKGAYPNTLDNPFDKIYTIVYDPEEDIIIEDGFIWNSDKSIIIFAPCTLEGNYSIPNSVTLIDDCAFYACSKLTSVEIPNSVKSIGDYAFNSCSALTSVVIPNSVTSISNYAFSGCTNLTSVEIPNSVKSIGDYAFSRCSALTSVVIPNSVTSIGDDAFNGCTNLTSVVIGNAVKSIGYSAFYACGITSVIIPSSVTSIGYNAFSNCDRLQKGAYPNTLDNPFSKAYTVVYNPEEDIIEDGFIWNSDKSIILFATCTLEGNYFIPNSVTSIGNYAFLGCSALTSIEIPNSVKSIGERAFQNSSMASVKIGDSVGRIDQYAFSGCSSLTKAEFASIESLCRINFQYKDSNPLYYAHHLYINGEEITELVIPESLDSIGNYVFYGCTSLASATIGDSVESIGSYAFSGCSSLTSVTIGNSVGRIDEYSFSGCSQLASIEIPNSVKSIGFRAFQGCTSLTSATIGNAVETIGESAFNGCTSLTSATIGNSVETIGYKAFSGCSQLASIEIPNSVTSIRSQAFSGCTDLKTVKVQWNEPLQFPEDAFDSDTYLNAVLDIPAEKKYEYLNSDWGKFTNISIDGYASKIYNDGVFRYRLIENPENPQALLIAGNYYSMTEAVIPERFADESDPANPVRYYVTEIAPDAFRDCTNLKSVSFNSRSVINAIGDNAFYGCRGIKSIALPASVTALGDSVFFKCTGLAEVKLGESVESIGGFAFSKCSALTSISIPESVKSIGEWAFYECDNMAKAEFPSIEALCSIKFGTASANPLWSAHNLYINDEKITDVIIPETIDSIARYSFSGCSMTSVEIPESVKSIGLEAFRACNSLRSVYIPNSVDSIDQFAFLRCDNLENVTIGANVKLIHNAAFSKCKNLKVVTMLDGIDQITIFENAFYEVPLRELYLGRTLKTQIFPISQIEKVIIGNTVSEIGTGFFKNSKTLTSLILGSALTAIGDNAFSGCTALEDVIVPPSVESIGVSAFDGDTKLKSIIMGHSVKTIGEKAFNGAPAATVSITAQEPPTAPNNTFSNYTGKLYVQGEGTAQKYYDALTCWDRFDSYVMIVPEKLEGNNNKVIKGEPDEQVQLEARIWPDNVTLPHVFWRSTNPEIATVDENGLVTFHVNVNDMLSRAGASCKIIAETLYADGPVLEFDVEVVTTGTVQPTGITLDAATAEITEGETKQLTATIAPDDATDKTVTWTSSDESVATVSASGLVAAIKLGTATITATTANGLTASCEVTVVSATVIAGGVTLNRSEAEVVENETLQLTATVTPDNATDKTVTWTSSDEAVATVSASGLVAAIKPGTATITATTANGLTATCTITVVAKPSGIDNVDDDSKNPVHIENGEIVIDGDGTAEVFNISGVRVAVSNEGRISGLPRGIYIVRLAGKTVKVRL